ncbi:MAG: DNA-processing protein DprA [Oscillospiraceae bacterium]|nr:DNA-processing protein DprA [Oscillospiraceae bacterium]
MAPLKYWIWLASLPGLTNRSKLLLLEHFSSPEDVYYADEELAVRAGLSREQAQRIGDKSLRRTEQILSECARKELFAVTMADAAYPVRLRNIYDPPLLLYGKGAMPLFDEEAAIGVVGTRKATPYGVQAAEELSCQMARQGALIVSGMALGIDAAAHRGALRAGGFTAAVLGCGVDMVYPEANRRIYEDIAATGVLLSEYPPGSGSDGWHFPARNRIISGLSAGVLVVEAPKGSGALITANMALEQGRDVFAVPGPIDAPNSWGCHQLIRGGAGLVSDAWDLLSEYEGHFPHKLHLKEEKLTSVFQEEPAIVLPGETTEELPLIDGTRWQALDDDQRRILRTMQTAPMLTDDIADAAELPVRRVLSALTVLEIEGCVRSEGGRYFTLAVRLNGEE